MSQDKSDGDMSNFRRWVTSTLSNQVEDFRMELASMVELTEEIQAKFIELEEYLHQSYKLLGSPNGDSEIGYQMWRDELTARLDELAGSGEDEE